jgi:S-adenosylmethionine:tRNA ribosyltransferase-isomerase
VKTADFDYDLPPHLIAQTPVEPRDAARLLVLERQTGRIEHTLFLEIGSFLQPGDLLVLNETRVIPARLYARKVPGGGRVELLLLRRENDTTWEALAGGKGLSLGKHLQIEDGPLAEITAVLSGPRRLVRFTEPLDHFLGRAGHVPLPPYIHTPLENPGRYQTVFARRAGSAAAPTAGLHFTRPLMAHLRDLGLSFAAVTLHIGLDTFAPVTEGRPEEHKIHTEWCQVTPEAAQAINEARRSGGRIIAVGTTSVRTLETAAREADRLRLAEDDQSIGHQVVAPFTGPTDLFILPGYKFRAVDALITNFHLPRSTLIMLVSAFAGREQIMEAYETAKKEGYRFYSFGDAMLIL